MTQWADLRADEFDRALQDPGRWFVLLPIGAIEQHGSHLPVDVDIRCAQSVCDAVAAADPNVIVAPALPFGFSPAQTYRPGTITLRSETLLNALRDICGSIFQIGFQRLLIVNGHNGNKWMAGAAVSDVPRPAGTYFGMLTYFDLAIDAFQEHRVSAIGGEGHAGELETAIYQHLRPDFVGDDMAVKYVESFSDAGFVDLAVRGPAQLGGPKPSSVLYPDGVMGDPTGATAELGARLFDAAVEGIKQIVADVAADAAAATPTTEGA
ncbi:MAG TPA: creatininase family protein [Baekduia sp.]|nr:creatininase family protein [Baekduia sp.]